MKKIRSNGVSALETTPVYASQLNEVTEVINKSLGLDADGDGDFIPENVYPVADGEGGLVAGNIKIYPGALYENIIIGGNAGESMDSDNNGGNIIIGENAGEILTNGVTNVFIGYQAGSRLTTATSNTIVGYDADLSTNSLQNCIALGAAVRGTKSGQAVLGNSVSIVETVTRGVHINTHTRTAKNTTATLTAAECLSGVITSTSAAAVELTLPTATALMALLNDGNQGTTFELIIDNSAGANSVTITPSATIAAITSPFTVTNPMIVTTAQKVGCFKFYFTSATSAIVSRIW